MRIVLSGSSTVYATSVKALLNHAGDNQVETIFLNSNMKEKSYKSSGDDYGLLDESGEPFTINAENIHGL